MKTFTQFIMEMEQFIVPEKAYKNTVTFEEFTEAVKEAYHKHFPKSMIDVKIAKNGDMYIQPRLAANEQERGKGDLFSDINLICYSPEIYRQSGKKFIFGEILDFTEWKDHNLRYKVQTYGASSNFTNVFDHHPYATILVKSTKSASGFEKMKLKDKGPMCDYKSYKKDLDKYFKNLKTKISKLYKEDKLLPEHKELWEKKGY